MEEIVVQRKYFLLFTLFIHFLMASFMEQMQLYKPFLNVLNYDQKSLAIKLEVKLLMWCKPDILETKYIIDHSKDQ